MYMGLAPNKRGLRIQLYKHRDTRRYLNLDDAGHAYEYRGDSRYRCHRSVEDAVHHVGIREFLYTNLYRSFPPEAWPADPRPCSAANMDLDGRDATHHYQDRDTG